jgi:hypothetical protein
VVLATLKKVDACKQHKLLWFEVLTAVVMKCPFFWDKTPRKSLWTLCGFAFHDSAALNFEGFPTAMFRDIDFKNNWWCVDMEASVTLTLTSFGGVNSCWPSLAQSFLGPSPAGLVIIFFTTLGVVKFSDFESQSHVTTDGQSVSPSWSRATFGAHAVWQLLFCRGGAPALTRGLVCHLS